MGKYSEAKGVGVGNRSGRTPRGSSLAVEVSIAKRGLAAAMVIVCAACGVSDSRDEPVQPAAAIPAGPSIVITLYGEDVSHSSNLGETLPIDGRLFTVSEIRPWSGLVRVGAGPSMASVALRDAEGVWVENVFLVGSEWRVMDQVSFRFRWHESESDARDAAAVPFDRAEGARWGVRDTDRVHWLSTFTPGDGAVTDDGTRVALISLGREAGLPALEVEVDRDGELARRVIAAAGPGDDLVAFEVPGLSETVVLLDVWREGTVLVRAILADGVRVGPRMLKMGEKFDVGPSPLGLRVDQALASAGPVEPQDSTVSEVVLSSSTETLRIREGEAVRVDDALIRFLAGE